LKSRTRRSLAALASAASLAAGLLGAAASNAQALSISAKGGQISLYGGSGVETVNPDGTGLSSVPGISNVPGIAPNWAPDGSRVLGGSAVDQLTTVRTTGATSPVTLESTYGPSRGSGYQDAVYWLDGSYVISSTGEELFYGPSDGSYAEEPLLTDAQDPSSDCDGNPTTSPTGLVAFDRTEPCGNDNGPGIWTYDPAADAVTRIVTSGSYPAFSADGSQLAYTAVVDGRKQLFVAAPDGTGAKQVTTDAADHTGASWDPDGGRIAYDSTDPATGTVTTKMLTLSDGSTATLTDGGTKPAWQPLRSNSLDRVYGTGAIGIDDAASAWTFDAVGAAHVPGLIPARSAVLVNKGNSTYAAPGISLAAEKQGPLLMTSTNSLDAAASTELKRSLPKGSTVYLVGGTNLLGSAVATQVQALGYTPLRMDGTDLAGVSARVARQITTVPSWVFVADGTEYHDPIAASTAAASLGYRGLGVVLITRGTTVPSTVMSYLNALDPSKTNLVSVGTNARKALENAPFTKQWSFWDVSGSSNELTAVNLAKFWWAAPNTATVEDTWTWQNAVAGGAATATYGPMLWSTVDALSSQSAAYLAQESASVQNVQTFGGNDAYSIAERTDIGNAIGVSSSWLTTVWAAGGVPPVIPSATSAGKSLRAAVAPSTSPAASPAGKQPALSIATPGHRFPAPNAHTGR
jgi:hypothetical protein